MYYSYRPDNFQPEKALPQNLWKSAEYANALIHILLVRQSLESKDDDEFVSLKVEYLRQIIPDRLEKPLRHALIASGVIECDGRYRPTEKAYGYRLGKRYRGRQLERVSVGKQSLALKLDIRARIEPENSIHDHLLFWLKQVEVKYCEAVHTLKPDPDGMMKRWTSLALLHDQRIYFTCDAKSGRVSTPVTNLWTKLRPFLRLQNLPLVNIDIRNSQPLLLTLLMKDYFSKKNNLSSPSPSCHHMMSIFDSLGDVKEYISLCEKGQLYSHLMQQWQVARSLPQFKESFFAQILFSMPNTRPLSLLFAKQFPHVMECINHYKQHNNRDLPILLQKAEADIIITGVCGTLSRDYPHIPVLTIHDSIMTTPPHAHLVADLIRAQFAALGLTPTLSPAELGSTPYPALCLAS